MSKGSIPSRGSINFVKDLSRKYMNETKTLLPIETLAEVLKALTEQELSTIEITDENRQQLQDEVDRLVKLVESNLDIVWFNHFGS